ncbi:TonB-dependent receptor domain-containing protein [Lichenicoccus sp.]|uniref:TonB-dependent receptor domain-containing protein n=1 Tax=Lichenicoccus sp. TaxID=2781899 RepID=UPI003D12086D
MQRVSLSSLRSRLIGSVAVTALLGAAPALAQATGSSGAAAQTPAGGASQITGTPGPATAGPVAGSSQNVIVTGSLIAHTNAASENPVTVVSSQDIARTSSTTVTEVLQRLPSIGSSGLYSSTNNGGDGASCVDIRNLGISRTLVLVDGKRFVHSGISTTDCVDLNNIPVPMIDRIEILKDGASSIYGADAVAGVVNIILKKQYTGTVVNLGGRITDVGDAREGDASFLHGFNFDRGSLLISGSVINRGPVEQKDRSWATPIVVSNPAGGPQVFGSGTPLGGRIFDSPTTNGAAIGSGSLLATGPNSFVPYNRTADGYDFGQPSSLTTGLTDENISGKGYYDVNSHIEAYVNAYYTHKVSNNDLAPQPVTGGYGSNPNLLIVPQGNPFIPASLGGEDLQLYRRVGEFGHRRYEADTDTYQFVGGIRGDLIAGWSYDASYTYGKSVNTINTYGSVNFRKFEQELGFRNTSATDANVGVYDPTVCQASVGCSLINPFGPTSISQAGVNYARYTQRDQATFQLRDLNFSLTNPSVVQLPFGPLGIAAGMEHRGEQGTFNPDPITQAGDSAAAPAAITSGGFNSTEGFGELSIPILANLPGAKDLSADVSGRYSDYSNFGNAKTWKLGGNYTPIEGIRFRGSIGNAFRQPGINELYGGQTISFNAGHDPCDAQQILSYTGVAGANVAANCRSQGLPATFIQNGAGQIQTRIGGNPNLQPETSRTYTFGVVLQPKFLKNFATTIDYWHTKVDQSIGQIDTQTILDGCYTSAGLSNQFCGLIRPRGSDGQIREVEDIYQNLGVTRTEGIDWQLDYLIRLGGGKDLALHNDMAALVGYESQNVPDGPFINYTGRLDFGIAYGPAYPRIRDTASAVFDQHFEKSELSFGYTMRFISGVTYYSGGDLQPGVDASYRSPGVFYHDIFLTYDWHHVILTGGVDNLLDRNPPFVPDASSNTAPSVYDVIGRLIYLKTSFRF